MINSSPTHPDTILTAMNLIVKFAKDHEQKYSYMECDMAIYKLAMHIKWSNPNEWKHLIIFPGGMHTMMSFIGCIGTLMQGTGLDTILSSAFKGVENMLNGKVWTKALRGLRMMVIVILENIVSSECSTAEEMQLKLDELSINPTAKVWIDCFLKPLCIAHLFLRAPRQQIGCYIFIV